jgi:hypothetical protein
MPTVGMGTTELCWTDRHAYTVVEVVSDRKIIVQRDTATRSDKDGMSDSQSYTYTPNPNEPRLVLTLRKDGKWRRMGDSGNVFALGFRQEYQDYSF